MSSVTTLFDLFDDNLYDICRGLNPLDVQMFAQVSKASYDFWERKIASKESSLTPMKILLYRHGSRSQFRSFSSTIDWENYLARGAVAEHCAIYNNTDVFLESKDMIMRGSNTFVWLDFLTHACWACAQTDCIEFIDFLAKQLTTDEKVRVWLRTKYTDIEGKHMNVERLFGSIARI
jgi:hypothetical protein